MKKLHTFNVRLDKESIDKIKARAKKQNITMSEYMRTLIEVDCMDPLEVLNQSVSILYEKQITSLEKQIDTLNSMLLMNMPWWKRSKMIKLLGDGYTKD